MLPPSHAWQWRTRFQVLHCCLFVVWLLFLLFVCLVWFCCLLFLFVVCLLFVCCFYTYQPSLWLGHVHVVEWCLPLSSHCDWNDCYRAYKEKDDHNMYAYMLIFNIVTVRLVLGYVGYGLWLSFSLLNTYFRHRCICSTTLFNYYLFNYLFVQVQFWLTVHLNIVFCLHKAIRVWLAGGQALPRDDDTTIINRHSYDCNC